MEPVSGSKCDMYETESVSLFDHGMGLTFKHRIKSRLPFAGIIRSSLYSTHFQGKG